MKKKLLFVLLALTLCLGLMPAEACATQDGGFTISLKTAVYSISTETLVRILPEPASQYACGEDEFVTVCGIIENTSDGVVTLRNMDIRIDGGEKLIWKNDIIIEPGQSARFHVYHSNMKYLTPGLHTAVIYVSDAPLYSGRFSIGRDWSEVFHFPTEAQIAARPADERSPYMSAWLSMGNVRYDAYSVDFKSDYIPYGSYSCLFNGSLDLSSLKKQYASVETQGVCLYGGLQQGAEGEASNSILSMWDIYCTDKAGNTTIIHPTRTYTAENTNIDAFTGVEGDGSQTLLPYDWQAGRWYRMLLLCDTSKTTGNTTVEQWFKDLSTGAWTHICTYDTGIKNSGLFGDAAFFSENFLKQYAGEVRSLEIANVRIHTSEGWRDIESTSTGVRLHTSGVHANAYGSWEAGSDGNAIYMIATGVPGWGRTQATRELTVENRETGDPLE